ncbi:ABC transporter ATP-binding protein [Arsenicitalea aurantiaca]|uniref:ABC transporter ATP-binding protein n=1 Tax=Arsenicitalea aurantiaca TaxID=1783274 RepID=A0A433XL92_9HYPH|nr:ABC transporter ATP-binding protein [Arsenicitalea aurantiaca]RUT34852.1 ABC transporter ATP-binding protein [Arsenicitalea aurantiaca]
MDFKPPRPPAIATEGLNLRLASGQSELHILRDVTFRIEAGEVVAVVGPSGSGKTSLLMVLAGLERATSGSVEVAGTPITGLDEDRLALFRRDTLGILFQNFHLIGSMTALENVMLALEIAEDPRPLAELEKASKTALEAVGLGDRLGHLPSALSGGEQQRVGLARAIVNRPRLLLADEPTGNLDQATGGRIIDLIFSLARENDMAVMLITHDPRLAAKADRQLEMACGRLGERADA